MQRLKVAGYEWYERGKGQGIVAWSRKYRLKTLHLDTAYETRREQWTRAKKLETDLWVPALDRGKEREQGRGR